MMPVQKVEERVIPEHYVATVMLTIAEYDTIMSRASWAGMSLEQYMRRAALGLISKGC